MVGEYVRAGVLAFVVPVQEKQIAKQAEQNERQRVDQFVRVVQGNRRGIQRVEPVAQYRTRCRDGQERIEQFT